MNHIAILGRLVADPEQKATQTGKTIAKFRIADSQYNEESPTYFSCVAWEKRAETIVYYLHKGDQIMVSGRMVSRPYTDANGQKKTIWEVTVDGFEFGAKKQGNASSDPKSDNKMFDFGDDELPW